MEHEGLIAELEQTASYMKNEDCLLIQAAKALRKQEKEIIKLKKVGPMV
jgi:hypothetical protein